MSTDVAKKLTEAERRKFNDLDGIIRKGLQTFAEVGAALAIVRDQRLYREEYDSFEAYCQDRCGWSRDRADQLIGAHKVVESLPTNVGSPANEAQARALADVPAEQRATVLEEARTEAAAEGKHVTAERIRHTAHKYTPLNEREPSKPKAETPEDMASAIVRRAEQRKAPPTDGGVVTPPVTPPTTASGAIHEVAPRAVSEGADVDGPVVAFVRAIRVPCFRDIAGMTDEDAATVALLRSWCADVLTEYGNRRK